MLFSLLPLVLGVGRAEESPFMFRAGLNFGSVLGCLVFCFLCSYRYILDKRILEIIRRNCFNFPMLLSAVGRFNYAFFALAIHHIDISVATIVYETWPIFMVILIPQLFKKRYRKITPTMLSMLIMGFIGFVFIITGQSGGFGALDFASGSPLFIGVVFAIIGSLLSSLAVYDLKLIANLIKINTRFLGKAKDKNRSSLSPMRMSLFCVAIANVVIGTFSTIMNVGVGMINNESLIMPDWRMLGVSMFAGFALAAAGSVMRRYAILITHNPSITAISYATPIFALIWLGVFSFIAVPRPDYLIIGATIIISANLILNFEAEIRFAYKAFIIALWTCGVWIYLHSSFSILYYFEAVEITSVVFILLLAFRMDRLVRRTTDEENRVLLLFRKLGTLVRQKKINIRTLNDLCAIDTYKNAKELHEAYDKIKNVLSDARTEKSAPNGMLDEIEIELDRLAHSKQQGINFGELIALSFVGGTLIFVLLFFEPIVLVGWNGFLTEFSAFTLSAVMLFLFFNVLDLQHDRTHPTVKIHTKTNAQYSVSFRDSANRRFERSVSIIVCLAITLSYGWLLFGKWL